MKSRLIFSLDSKIFTFFLETISLLLLLEKIILQGYLILALDLKWRPKKKELLDNKKPVKSQALSYPDFWKVYSKCTGIIAGCVKKLPSAPQNLPMNWAMKENNENQPLSTHSTQRSDWTLLFIWNCREKNSSNIFLSQLPKSQFRKIEFSNL